jgi:hypothetical protein
MYEYIKIYLSLGAIHDGTGDKNCLASDNYIMTPSVGMNSNATNLYYFSNCSLNHFKSHLLTADLR